MNKGDIDIGVPLNIKLRNVFSQLIVANVLSSWQPYVVLLKPTGYVLLDKEMSFSENGVGNNDILQTLNKSANKSLPKKGVKYWKQLM